MSDDTKLYWARVLCLIAALGCGLWNWRALVGWGMGMFCSAVYSVFWLQVNAVCRLRQGDKT